MEQTDARGRGWIGRVIDASARSPLLTLLLAAGLTAWGLYSLRHGALDAIPDLSDLQVIVSTEWPGRSPDLVEQQITYPITSALLATPRVRVVRGQSFFGLSFVYVIFTDATDIYWARSRVLEYLETVRGKLPEGVTPTLGPDASGVGWVLQYALVDRSNQTDLQQLRGLQDWHVRYALQSVPGVAEVASLGGMVKQYQVQLDPTKLFNYGITVPEIVRALRESNSEAGGKVIEIAGHEHMIRGRGYITSVSDIEGIPVRVSKQGTPILLKEIANVAIGPDMRRGIAELDGEGEVVGGIVVMRYGQNALNVIDAVKRRMEAIQPTLPQGVQIEITYDRSGLINDSIKTLTRTLIEEALVVSAVIFVFLLHFRSALVAIFTLPVAIVLAFIPMYYQGLTANIMSLGGIAVAIGAMVDASIVMIENVHKKLEAWEKEKRSGARGEVVIQAMQEVGPTLFFSLLVITVSFLPVFTLEATEGRLFKPLVFTKTYAMGFAAILAITVGPALAALFIRGKIAKEETSPLNRALISLYSPVVRLLVRFPGRVIAVAFAAMALTLPVYLRLGGEFMPPFNEGTILYMPTSPPGMSITQAADILQTMDRELKKFPEVLTVFGKMGRADSPTDPAPLGMAEATILLKPRDRWRRGLGWDGLIREMDEKLRYPGMPNLWWMPIQTRTEMLSTGIRSPVGVEIFGADLQTVEHAAVAIEEVLTEVPGTRSAFAERSTGGFFLDFDIKRHEAAKYGLRVEDVNQMLMTAIGGMNVAETVEGRERYPISIRYAREFRDDPERLRRILLPTPSGARIPLGEVAEMRSVTGPEMIRSEEGQLVGLVAVDVAGRPIADYVEDAQRAVGEKVKLPAGVRLAWVGQYQSIERVKAKLEVVVPVTLLLVVFLLYLNTQSWIQTGIVLLAVPFSLIGAIWLVYLLGYNMSVAVWVGLIALAGLDAETGVVMLLYLNLSYRRWQAEGRLRTREDLHEAIVDGAARRVRPKLMTVLTAMMGLMPILWSTGPGADLMKRIAAPMVGGLVSSFLLELAVYPVVFASWKRRELSPMEGDHSIETAKLVRSG
jgi:copper/silver efflux system protein